MRVESRFLDARNFPDAWKVYAKCLATGFLPLKFDATPIDGSFSQCLVDFVFVLGHYRGLCWKLKKRKKERKKKKETERKENDTIH